MSQTVNSLIKQWRSYLGATTADVIKRFKVASEAVDPDTWYGNLDGLTEVFDFELTPGHFFFRNDRCILFYIEEINDELEGVTPEILYRVLGQPAASLPSRASKAHKHEVYPEQGIAFSAGREQVDYLEVFQPTTLEKYKSNFYIQSGPQPH